MTPANAMKLNAVALYAISAVLLVAFYFQFELGELPCPLCLLQRVAFTALAVGPILTLRHGPRPGHYGLIILAALLGAAIASRQVLLHIMPGDAGYGSALLGSSRLVEQLVVHGRCGTPGKAALEQRARAIGERDGENQPNRHGLDQPERRRLLGELAWEKQHRGACRDRGDEAEERRAVARVARHDMQKHLA